MSAPTGGTFELSNGDLNLLVSGLGSLLATIEAQAKLYGRAEAEMYIAPASEVRALRDRLSGRPSPTIEAGGSGSTTSTSDQLEVGPPARCARCGAPTIEVARNGGVPVFGCARLARDGVH